MPRATQAATRIHLVATLLAGAWRAETTAARCSPKELERMTPLLVETGAGALAWRRVRHSPLSSTPSAEQLRDAYRLYKLLAVIYRREVADVFRLLRSSGVEPVMVKGWAVARHYGEACVRPSGDIDLCVRQEEHALAQEVLKSRTGYSHNVDLHTEFQRLDTRSFDELAARSELIELEGESIRVLKAEDHLRVLCYHFLREGGWRPIWLCDVAAAVESRKRDFDWGLCLGEEPMADWVACVVGLAHKLLGAEISDTPVAARAASLPGWLAPSVLGQWETRSLPRRQFSPILDARSHPLRVLRGLRYHWPSPVEATVMMGRSFSPWPRLPIQLGNCLARAALFLRARLERA